MQKISLGNTIGDEQLYVWTTHPYHTLGYVTRTFFALIHSVHDDAPLVLEPMDIDDVNLKPGELPAATLQELCYNLPGGMETMALAEARNAARKSMLDDPKPLWVKFRPIKLSEGDLVLVNHPKSDWLQKLYRVDKAVQKKDLESAKIGAYFSVVDRVDP